MNPIGVAVVGCGVIGRRRAATAAADARTVLRLVVDSDRQRARALAAEHDVGAAADWREALAREDVAAVVVCTPNALLVPIAVAAVRSGRHVLIEKPMGRNATEGRALTAEAARASVVLKVGFNHRYHPAIARAYELFRAGAIGRLIQMRARYGHGGRPGAEQEWRANAEVAGGGELLDQGVHIIDLFQWFGGQGVRAQAEIQRSVWPIGRLEDNAFGLLRFAGDAIGQFHVSMTQWKNLFSLEIHGETGALAVEGLGGSYGVETLTIVRRNLAGGVPDTEQERFEGTDSSWADEWSDFAGALHGARLRHDGPEDGLRVMATVDALYAAARSGAAVEIDPSGGSAPRPLAQ